MEAYLELGMNPNQNLFSKCCQTKKEICWFYWDLSKKSWNKNNVERERMEHTFRIVDMCKCQWVIWRHKWSPCYQIAHGWKISGVYINRISFTNKNNKRFLRSFHFFSSFFFFLFFLYGDHMVFLPPQKSLYNNKKIT